MPIEVAEKKYVGKGWQNKGGISISVNKEEVAKLEANKWGEVRLFVGIRKSPPDASQATHWVAVDAERKSTGWSPPRPPEGMPEDPPGTPPWEFPGKPPF